MRWDGWGFYQRTMSDCGCAALGTLIGLTYEQVAEAWIEELGREPAGSHYWQMIAVLRRLGIQARKVGSCGWGIRRARCRKGDRHSHWIVTYSDGGIWCPTLGHFSSIKGYGMPNLGHGIIIV